MTKHTTIIGIDLGDKYNRFCVLDAAEGEVQEEGRVLCGRNQMARFFTGRGPARVVLEAGTHSAWVSALAAEAGHEALVANPRKARAIYANERKSDKVDAEMLARLGRMDPKLLKPIRHRDRKTQADLAVLKARQAAVETRTKLVNQIRGMVKSFGGRLPACSTPYFHVKTKGHVPEELWPALKPLYDALEQITATIKEFDRRCKALCESEAYQDTQALRSVPGVGALTSLAFVTVLEESERYPTSRSVGAYLGLTPKQDQSGESNPQLRITKAGNDFLRKLLVGSAQYILGRFGPDSQLRRWGKAIEERGGRNAKKRAVVAVARKLAVILHRLWSTGEVWEPFPEPGAPQAEDAA